MSCSTAGDPTTVAPTVASARTARWDDSITVTTAVDGKEAQIDYDAATWREVGGEYQVTYDFDPADSEQVEAPEDRGGRQ